MKIPVGFGQPTNENKGLTFAAISLSNPRDENLAKITRNALVETGALMLCIPSEVAAQLNLSELDRRPVVSADGSVHQVPYVGPIRLDFENRFCFVGALVLGDEVLLGAVPMEDMDLVVHPGSRTLTVNPLHPNKPQYSVK